MPQRLMTPLIALTMLLIFAVSMHTGYAQQDSLSVVEEYQVLHNSEQIDEIMALFTADAEFELVGQGTLTGEALRAIHEYDSSINGRLAFINCETDNNVVTCQTVEFNDWIETAGLQPIFYSSSVFTINDGKISRIRATMSPEPAQAIGETLAVFIPWLMENRATEAVPLFSSTGAFIYSRENGELVVQLLQEWREATAP